MEAVLKTRASTMCHWMCVAEVSEANRETASLLISSPGILQTEQLQWFVDCRGSFVLGSNIQIEKNLGQNTIETIYGVSGAD